VILRSCPSLPRGHITEEEYLAENAHLEEQRAEFELTTAPAPTIRLDGLLATWHA
jgi:hypothetical protein